MKSFLVLGSGRQGCAAGYDLAQWGEADEVVMADASLETAQKSAHRINVLLGKEIAKAIQVDVRDEQAVRNALQGKTACLSAVPYFYNLPLTKLAIESKVHFCDLGGNTDIARDQHKLDREARQNGVSIIPNCGQVPGMGTTLIVYAISLLDETLDVYMWDGGLPQNPKPPFNYLLTFNIAGLTNEYAEPAVFLRNWRITQVESITELETVEFPPPIGTLEAFVTGGGLDTLPWTYEGKLRTLQNLTLRYPGHYEKLRAYRELGLWELNPIRVGNVEVVPREVFHALFEPKVVDPTQKDFIIIRIRAVGKKEGREAEAWVEVIDYYDEQTGFTAMERGTGWSAAIVAEMMARGETPRGAGGVEKMVPPEPFIKALEERGIRVRCEIRYLTN
ncbi:MAG: saccharopine dehydrogenase NADP-binding domain-containing protein [Anaerolineales bacterium]|nr:saccharopine dehydrogenase NADP-binding domain-containing protein [Anaerolineales bacterium]MDW8161818.1 saccharopine dehydrogenase C-terminal domain-containing protein [Anaerolineales bacterium]